MARRSEPRAGGDAGSAGIEAGLAIAALVTMMLFIVGALRVTTTNGDVDAAARAAARAAAAAPSTSIAEAEAAAVASSMLASRGVACAGGPKVSVTGAGVAGSLVTATVTCTISLADVVLVKGFPGSTTATSTAVEFTDTTRGF